MGRGTYSATEYKESVAKYVPSTGPATARAEQQAHATGKLHELVDPAGYDVIRRSLPRLELQDNGLWMLTVGTPMAIEAIVDTTGSMGTNVDTALAVLPHAFERFADVLPGYDLQIATGIFGDKRDKFILCRPQFEMVPSKIVEQLTLMVPERKGDDFPEDPHYGLFGAAYLTAAHITRLGLKSYHFTVSDATARDRLDPALLRRVFGPEVFNWVKKNGHQVNEYDLPSTVEVVRDLLTRAHAFFLQVGDIPVTTSFWTEVFGNERVVSLPNTELLPQVQAVIIGLTEGTLSLSDVPKYLRTNNVKAVDVDCITKSVAKIPLCAQAQLPNFGRRPQKGDLFRAKTDLWPVKPSEVPVAPTEEPDADPDEVKWL